MRLDDMAYKEIYLDSPSRRSGSSNNNPHFDLDNIEVDYLKIKDINLPISWNNVTKDNNTFQLEFSDDPDVKTVTIPEGVYNKDNLATTLKTKIEAVSGLHPATSSATGTARLFDVTISDTTNQLKISFTSGDSGETFRLIFNNEISKLFGFLGGNTTAFGRVVIASNPVNLESVDVVYVVSNNIRGNRLKPGFYGSSRILGKVNIYEPSQALQVSDFSNITYDAVKTHGILNDFDLSIINASNMQPLDLRGHPWSLTLSCFS